jgi:hypothetical protein
LPLVLLVVGALLLLLGVSNESTGENTSRESSESIEGHVETGSVSSEAAATAPENRAENHTESTVLGVDTESNAAVGAAVAISLALAALLVLVEGRVVAAAVAIVAFAATVLDVAEVAHQIDAYETGAVLAIVVALVHLGSGGLAAALTPANLPVGRPEPRQRLSR